MALPQLRSPLARAIVPVLGGLLVLALIAGVTWMIAALITRGDTETTDRLAPPTFRLGSVERRAADIAENGPLLFPGLNTTVGERSIVLNHEGNDPSLGWVIYYAFPADRDVACPVEQVPGTADFIDCEGRELTVDQLAPPDSGVRPIVENREQLIIDLRSVTTPASN